MLRDLLELIKLKVRAFYWIGNAVIDRSGRTKHPGLVLAVARYDVHLISMQDGGDDARDARADWNRLFGPEWDRSCVLMIFYPTFDKACTWEQFVASVQQYYDRLGKPENMPTEEQMRCGYSRIRPSRTLWVPAVGMKRIPLWHFWSYWKDKNDYQRPQSDSCPGCSR